MGMSQKAVEWWQVAGGPQGEQMWLKSRKCKCEERERERDRNRQAGRTEAESEMGTNVGSCST